MKEICEEIEKYLFVDNNFIPNKHKCHTTPKYMSMNNRFRAIPRFCVFCVVTIVRRNLWGIVDVFFLNTT